MANKRVFISHAAKDKPVVDSFFDLLQTGIGLSPDETFCSSLEGMGIPPGGDFVSYIKGQVQSPELIILMLSPNYLESIFCLCELGAGWAMSHNMIPIIIPPANFTDLKAVLSNTHALRIDLDTDLSALRDRITELLHLATLATPRWDAKRKKFLAELPTLLGKADHPAKVPYSDYDTLKKTYDESVAELQRTYEEIEVHKRHIEALKKCKDLKEVREIEREFSDEFDYFREICRAAEKLSDPLPGVVIEAIYHDKTNMAGTPNGREIWDAIARAQQNGFLIKTSTEYVAVNYDDPKVRRYDAALDLVREFLQGGGENAATSDFWEQYEEEHDYAPSFDSRRFWEEHLGLAGYTQW